MTKRILGLVCETHDTGLALLEDGRPRLILEEERHNREKHTLEFPARSLGAAFERTGLTLSDIDVIATPWDPHRIRRSYAGALLRNFPFSLTLFRQAANTAQRNDVALMNFWMRRYLRNFFPGQKLPPIVNVAHHDAHAAIYFVSPFEDATVIVMDGYGDDAATSVYTGEGRRLTRQWHGGFFDSLGICYSLVTGHLGWQVFEEGTVMALAACGSDRLVAQMRDLVRLQADGRFKLNMDYFSFDKYGMIRPFKRKFYDVFGPARRRDEPLTDHHRDLARALQRLAEDVVMHVVTAARRRFPSRNLCFTGGVALNCVANARVLATTQFDRVWVPPCASDTGAPYGAALWHNHVTLARPRGEPMTHAYYGLDYDEAEIAGALQRAGLAVERLDDDVLLSRVAANLADEKIVGWFQGRYEIGPRALGNRSILASPIGAAIRDTINTRVKFREQFRPFAPSVLAEHAAEWFEISQPDPFMTLAPKVRPDKAGRIPAAVHVDGTARIQTVERDANPRYWALIDKFGELTGVPIVINTSFNKQEPVVARPEEAISCYLRTDMDVLVMGNHYCTDRPIWSSRAFARGVQCWRRTCAAANECTLQRRPPHTLARNP